MRRLSWVPPGAILFCFSRRFICLFRELILNCSKLLEIVSALRGGMSGKLSSADCQISSSLI